MYTDMIGVRMISDGTDHMQRAPKVVISLIVNPIMHTSVVLCTK